MIKINKCIIIFVVVLFVIPCVFSADNQTQSNDSDSLSAEYSVYYFNSSASSGGDGSQDNPYNSLNGNIKSYSTHYLANGNYENFTSPGGDYQIIGQDANNTIINGNGGTLNNFISLKLVNLTLVNYQIVNAKVLNATNVIFTNVTSSSAITSTNITYLNNCSFTNNGNCSINYGGAIKLSQNSKTYIDNCIFMDNGAKLMGGAIYCENSLINIQNSRFKNSKANLNSGGAIFLKSSNLTANYLTITNSSSIMGGGISAISSNLDLNYFIGDFNNASYEGGSIYQLYGIFSIQNSNLTNNYAALGAGLFIDNVSSLIISNNNFIKNNASVMAAGFYSLCNSNSTVSNNIFENNYALSNIDYLETFTPYLNIGSGNYTMYMYNSTELLIIPSSYDLRELGYVTSVKNQGNDGNCWAFAAMAVLESCILKAGGPALDLSESNLKNLYAEYSDYGWDLETNNGGYAYMGYTYFVSWLGPVLESDDPYILNTFFSPVLNSIMHVQNVLFLQRKNLTDNDDIKRAIMQYGAVYSPINTAGSIGNNKYYYSGGTSANHAIVIVGWDDGMEFSGAPGKGGWIIKNSWGSSSGDNGYYYVSYYDTSCAPIGKTDSTFTFILNDTVKFDKNYQYDIPGKSDFFLNSSSTVWYKNIFTATDDEYLAAVSTIFSDPSNYEFSIYVNNEFILSQSGYTNAGYYTFNLNQYIPLNKVDVFEVIFKISVDGEAGVPISENVSFNKCLYSENISFISYDGNNWLDLYDLNWKYSSHIYDSQVACIKAFTIFDKLNTSVNISFNIDLDDVLIVNANVYNQYGYLVTGGNVTFNINGETYDVVVKNGIASLEFDMVQTLSVEANYSNEGFVSSQGSNLFISPMSTTLKLVVEDSHNPICIIAKVTNVYDEPVKLGNVTFNVENQSFNVSVVDGKAILNHTFINLGLNTIQAIYNGFDDYYYESNDTLTINASKTTISMDLSSNKLVNYVEITVQFSKSITELVYLSVNGNIYTNTSSKGKAIFILENLTPNDYNITAYIDSYAYESNSATTSFTVYNYQTNLNASDLEVYVLNNNVYSVILKDGNNTPLTNKNIIFKFNNKNITASTDNNGVASINIKDFAVGIYSTEVIFEDGVDYNSVSKNVVITVKTTIVANNSTKTYNSYYQIIFYDQSGNLLKNTKINITVGSKTYTYVSDSKGIVSLYINYNPGNYVVKLNNPSNGESKNINLKIVKRIDKNANLVMYYAAGKYYKVRVLDDNGNAAVSVKVTFKISGKTYYAITNNKGYASIKIKLKPKTYKITAQYKGFKVSNKITIKSTLVTKNINVKKGKTIKFSAKLLNKNGKILKYKRVTFKFMGKTYKIKTNKKGIATLKLTKKYKTGKHAIYTSYGTLKIKNIIRIKK